MSTTDQDTDLEPKPNPWAMTRELATRVELRPTHNTGAESYWELRLEDDKSHLLIGTIKLTNQQLGAMLGGAVQVAPFLVFPIDERYGKTCEIVTIPVPLSREDFKGEGWEANVRHVVWRAMKESGHTKDDGWSADLPKAFNHTQSYPDGYHVRLRRYV